MNVIIEKHLCLAYYLPICIYHQGVLGFWGFGVLGRQRRHRRAAPRRPVVRGRRPASRACSSVEDSVGVRELQRVILEGAGYDVVDGGRRPRRRRPPRARTPWTSCSPTSRCRAWTGSRSPARSGAPAAGRTSPS